MNVYAVTYSFKGLDKVIIIESMYNHPDDVKAGLHPAIANKVTDIEFVGTLA